MRGATERRRARSACGCNPEGDGAREGRVLDWLLGVVAGYALVRALEQARTTAPPAADEPRRY